MLSEKFLLVLEMLLKGQSQPIYRDGAPRVVSSAPHVPVKLAGGS